MAQARAEIERIKVALRGGGVAIEDEPNDEGQQVELVPQQRAVGDLIGGDKVGGDQVGGDRVLGDQRNINTEGGDYTEGSSDKRQGAFVSGGTVRGNIIGQQTIYQTLPIWLRFLSAFAIVVVLVVIILWAIG